MFAPFEPGVEPAAHAGAHDYGRRSGLLPRGLRVLELRPARLPATPGPLRWRTGGDAWGRRPGRAPLGVDGRRGQRGLHGVLPGHPRRDGRRVPPAPTRRIPRVPANGGAAGAPQSSRGRGRGRRRRAGRHRGRVSRQPGGPDRERSGMTAMALEGVRVLDFTQMMMGPWATQFLGDMGAEVIKVERPGAGEWERGLRAMGELLAGQSPFFLAMNRNKKSLTLNLKDPRAREIVLKLAETCDLVTENFRPGVMDRLGMGYEDLRKVNPSIVYVAGTGFGPDGPYADRPGQDLLIQSMSGLAAYGGRRDDPPTPSGSSIVDASTALMLAFSAMVGLFHRERTGQGQRIDVSLYGTAIALQCQELAAFMNLARPFDRSEAGIGGAWLSAPFGVYRTADGHLALAMGSLAVVGEVLDLPELAEYDTPERAWADRDDVYRMIAARLPEGTTQEWLDLLGKRDVWAAPVQTFDQVVEDPQVAHNEWLATVEYPGAGELRVVGVPFRFSETPGTIRLGPPTVGQHTDEVLVSIGYSPREIRMLRDAECV